jgi:hypothetical protein
MKAGLLPFLPLLAVLGCPTPEPEGPTWYGDVLPIAERRCLSCHHAGGIGTFSMEDGMTAAIYAGSIRSSVLERRMPPFPMNADGACQEWDDPAWLSQEEIDTIVAWVDAGALVGEERAATVPEPERLDGDDIVEVSVPTDYVPVAGDIVGSPTDDYQCFLTTVDALQGRFITGYEVLPDQRTEVHHVVGFLVDLEEPVGDGYTNADVLPYLDAQSPDQDGWDCDGSPGEYVIPRGSPIQWAPGQDAQEYPPGVGIGVGPTDVLVLQVHYTTAIAAAPDNTVVRLRGADSVEREGWFELQDMFLDTAYGPEPASLPAGQPDARFDWEQRLDQFFQGVDLPQDLEVLAVLPHMHKRGRLMDIDFLTSAGEVCGGRVDRWDFNWQYSYRYAAPVPLRRDDRLRVECSWDTRSDENDVGPGFSTQDEMCLLGLFVAAR